MGIGSANELELVRSICRQIHYVFHHDMEESKYLLTANYDECIHHFHKLLKGLLIHTTFLILDSLLIYPYTKYIHRQ